MNIRYDLRFTVLPRGRFRAGLACVFFAQHSVENDPKSLWEGRFFVAR